MRFRFSMTLIFLFIGTSLFAQELDPYKYIIVPKQFDFLRSADQYQLNSLTKFLFNKKGMVALFEGEKQPDDLFNDQCLGLKTKIIENSNLLSTKLAIELTDCRNATVYTSQEGKSKIKDLKKAHHDALRKAFQSIQALSYTYDQSLRKKTTSPSETAVLEEVKETPVEEPAAKAETTPATEAVVEAEEQVKPVVEEVQETAKLEEQPDTQGSQANLQILYAQELKNGFQLVDNTPKVVYRLLRTNLKDIFTLEGLTGIAYKKGDRWFVEYYFEGQLVTKELNIKF